MYTRIRKIRPYFPNLGITKAFCKRYLNLRNGQKKIDIVTLIKKKNPNFRTSKLIKQGCKTQG